MDNTYTQEEIDILSSLAEKTIGQLKTMPHPIVRVCGPLTTGGLGYEKNAFRLKTAEQILTEKGFTVFGFAEAEESIKDRQFSHQAIMEIFHKKVLDSGLIAEAFFLKGWDQSKGATIEREICEKAGTIAVTDFPEEWFGDVV